MKRFLNFFLLVVAFSLTPLFLQSQATEEKLNYAQKYSDVAIKKMKEYGIPASITLAQGILESSCGTSELAVNSNNHFGIKCHKEWTGAKYYYDDDEADECFRKYKTVEESYNDHSLFLTTRERYNNLFELDITDYQAWAYGLKAAGYATNPQYPKLLIKIIEDNELYKYDLMALGLLKEENVKVKADTVDIQDNAIDDKNNLDTAVNPVNDDVSLNNQQNRFNSNKNSHAIAPCDCMNKANFSEKYKGRDIYIYNNIYVTFALNDDSIEKIAKDLNVSKRLLRKYNDLSKGDKIFKDDIIYLEIKNNRSKVKTHVAEYNETLWFISQCYSVKLKKLEHLNQNTDPYRLIKLGTKIKLR